MIFNIDFVKGIVNNINTENVNILYNYLISDESDFKTSPASTRFHHDYEGGLLDHCCQIFKSLIEFKSKQMFNIGNSETEDLFILAFGHDLAKLNSYTIVEGWRKNSQGKWESYNKYDYSGQIRLPHELFSVYRLVKLMPEVKISLVQAIAYHHGSFNQSTASEYSEACRENPLVLALHTADMLSSIEGTKKD